MVAMHSAKPHAVQHVDLTDRQALSRALDTLSHVRHRVAGAAAGLRRPCPHPTPRPIPCRLC